MNFTESQVREAVDAEPEFPGKMPHDMQRAIEVAMSNGELDTIEELMRISVRLTKQGILERLGLHVIEKPGPVQDDRSTQADLELKYGKDGPK